MPTLFRNELSLLAEAESSTIDLLGNTPHIVLAVYLGVLLCLGIAGWLKSRAGEEDYYLAGREQGWVVSSLTIMATFFSSFALMGAPGMVYKDGIVFALFCLNVPVGGMCVYLLGSRIMKLGRRFGYITPGDMVCDYYGANVSLRLLVALAGFLYAIPYVIMQIKAGGLVSQKLFGEEHFADGAILLAGITTLYIMVGGMRSVAWTDLVQGLLLVSGMMVSGVAMILLFDGPMEFSQRIVTELPESSLTAPGNSGTWTWSMLLSVVILASVGSMIQPAQWMRYYSARSSKSLKRAAVLFAVVLTSCFILGVMMIGLAGQILYPLDQGVSATATKKSASQSKIWPKESEIAVPEDLRQNFRYLSPHSGDRGNVTWLWKMQNKKPALDEKQKEKLLSLSTNANYRAAVEELSRKVQDPETVLRVIPNSAVDPDPTDGEDFDSILVVVLQKQLPRNLGAFGTLFATLVIVAIMAASMSTADSNLHALSAVVTRDLYDQYLRPQASEKESVWIGRLVIVLATVLSLLVVILGRNPKMATGYEFMNMIVQMGLLAIAFSSQLIPITVDMLFLRKGTCKGATVGLAAGLFVTLVFGQLFPLIVDSLGKPEFLNSLLSTVESVQKVVKVHGSFWGLLVNTTLFILISLVTKKPNAEKVHQYCEIIGGAKTSN